MRRGQILTMSRHRTRQVLIAISLVIWFPGNMTASTAVAQSSAALAAMVETTTLRAEVNDFLAKEIAVHLSDIKTLDPPPERVVGALTTGEFSWGTFMYALARYAETTGQRELAGRNLAKWVGQIGRIEAKGGGKTFSQLYAALALRNFGNDLKTNPVWQSLTPQEQAEWRQLLNIERFYDVRT